MSIRILLDQLDDPFERFPLQQIERTIEEDVSRPPKIALSRLTTASPGVASGNAAKPMDSRAFESVPVNRTVRVQPLVKRTGGTSARGPLDRRS